MLKRNVRSRFVLDIRNSLSRSLVLLRRLLHKFADLSRHILRNTLDQRSVRRNLSIFLVCFFVRISHTRNSPLRKIRIQL